MARNERHERRFIRRLKKRDEAAFTEFVDEYKALVFAISFRMLHNYQDAEDLAQDIFVAAFKGFGDFREESHLRTWVATIAINHARNELRRRQRHAYQAHQSMEGIPGIVEEVLARKQGSHAADPTQGVEREEIREQVWQGLNALPTHAREILILSEIEGKSQREIGERLGLAIGTVKSRLFRAREALKAEMIKKERP